MYSIDAHATFEFKPTLFTATYGHEGIKKKHLQKRYNNKQNNNKATSFINIVTKFINVAIRCRKVRVAMY